MAPLNGDFDAFALMVDERVTARRAAPALVVKIYKGTRAAAPGVVVKALARRLRTADGRPLVPHAEIDEATSLDGVVVQLGNTTPRGWGTVRFPRYRALSAIKDGERATGALELAFHDLHPNLAYFVRSANQVGGLSLFFQVLLFILAGWAIRGVFRWSWRRRTRAWFPGYIGHDRADFFPEAGRLMWGPDRERQEGALLRALLCDLEAAFTPRLSPWRRRRRSRFVLFVTGDAALTDRVAAAVRDTRVRRTVVIAAPESGAEAPGPDLRWAASVLDGEAALDPAEGVIQGTGGLDAAALAGRSRIPVRLGSPALAATEAVAQGLAAVGLAAVLAIPWLPPIRPPDTSCLARPAPGPASPPAPVPDAAGAQSLYAADKQRIEAENARVDAKEKQGYTVKTVVYLGSGVAAFEHPEYNGVLPELRGIRLAQQKMNDMAEATPHSRRNYDGNVFVRVNVEEAGAGYAKAPEMARRIAAQPDRKVLGVIGLGESRKETIEAQRILGDGGLPMLGIGATSETFQSHPLYHQVSYDNPEQARLIAAFVRNAGVIPAGDGTCAPAASAVILGDPDDDYSKTLSDDFAAEFRPSTQLWFSPSNKSPQPGGKTVYSLSALADETCAIVAKDPRRTLVLWPGRAQRLRDFLQTVKGKNACPSALTVLAGADVTTTVTRAQQLSFDGVTLYYSAHALPSRPPNEMGREYLARYSAAYGHDAWYDHWRGPLAYDALMTMATAVNTVCQLNKAAGCGRGSVQVLSSFGVGGDAGLRGATGTIVYPSDPRNASGAVTVVPSDKRFLILRDTPQGPVVAMECGRRDGGDVKTTWGPHDEFACPRR
ncbi:hypothetical protein ACFYUV_35455 [Nonomuraea sp. NPDC003560]|uniref:hypothetical protein n=1 Tax=Nonomuraea sp. NPDC003560 TaxID=3364341 RepID=UPI003685B301